MATAEAVLLARARRAYEAGRALKGLRLAAVVVVPMAALSVVACGRPEATAIAAGALATLVAGSEWRGLGSGRGARVGVLAGLPPLLLPPLFAVTVRVCDPTLCMSGSFRASQTVLCLACGIVSGIVVGGWVARRDIGAAGLTAAVLAAGLAGSLGCLAAGFGGVMGLAAGLGLGATPLIVFRRA